MGLWGVLKMTIWAKVNETIMLCAEIQTGLWFQKTIFMEKPVKRVVNKQKVTGRNCNVMHKFQQSSLARKAT